MYVCFLCEYLKFLCFLRMPHYCWFPFTCCQRALRMIAFRQMHRVLGMDAIPPPKFQRGSRFTRKRRRDNSTGDAADSDTEQDGELLATSI